MNKWINEWMDAYCFQRGHDMEILILGLRK